MGAQDTYGGPEVSQVPGFLALVGAFENETVNAQALHERGLTNAKE